MRDKEVNCREKGTILSELKEKVVTLNSKVRQLGAELVEHDQKLKVSHLFYCSIQLSCYLCLLDAAEKYTFHSVYHINVLYANS